MSEGEALRRWVAAEQVQTAIEIGLGYGIAALYLVDADPAVSLVTLDPNQQSRFANIGLQLLEDAGARERVELIAEPSEIALPRLLSDARRFDFAFVDGNHRFDGVFLDLVYLGRLVKPAGLIFLDDYHLPSVGKAVAFFSSNFGWSVEEAAPEDPRHGWVALRTADPPLQRNFDHFVDF